MAVLNSEKLLKMDAKRREYDVVVIGEEAHLAYNRVGLTSFFQHRKAENLYLNPKEWVRQAPPNSCPQTVTNARMRAVCWNA